MLSDDYDKNGAWLTNTTSEGLAYAKNYVLIISQLPVAMPSVINCRALKGWLDMCNNNY